MRKWIFFLFPFLVFSTDLEVTLHTRPTIHQIYLSQIFGSHSQMLQTLRNLLVYDLNIGGFTKVLENHPEWEKQLERPFDLAFWQKQHIPYCLHLQATQNHLELTAFNILDGTSKKYSAIPFDRRAIHYLADALHKDLFGQEGIASLRLIYTQRTKTGTEKGLDWVSEVWVSDSDGENARQITNEK